jgi:hypothetical protein
MEEIVGIDLSVWNRGIVEGQMQKWGIEAATPTPASLDFNQP